MVRVWTVSALVLFVLFAGTGCTRKTSSTTTIRLSFGSVHKKDLTLNPNQFVAHIVLNITGPGIARPLLWQWDAHDFSGGTVPTPPPIVMDVPRGDQRLVQALVVIGSTTGGGMVFQYGDNMTSLASFQSDSADVTINVASVTGATSGDDQIGGRYLDATGNGPTGHIRVYYNPTDGAPSMLVDNSSEIFGGWFSVFGVDGAKLDYVLDNGADLFGQPMGVGDFVLSGALAMVVNPAYYSTDGGCSGSCTANAQPAGRSVYGFFGAGASGKQICFNQNSGPIASEYQSASMTSNINWNPLTGSPGVFDAYMSGGGTGSTPDASGLCTATGSRFLDYISLDEQALNHHDETLVFRGPFQLQKGSNGDSVLSVSVSGAVLTVGWQYLPGAETSPTSMGIDGADIYGRGPTANNYDFKGANDAVLCSQLTALGFSFLKNVPVVAAPAAGGTPYSVTASLPASLATAYSSNSATTIVCPYSNQAGGKVYFGSAAVAGGFGGGMIAANDFSILGPQPLLGPTLSPSPVANGICTPFTLRGLNGAQPAMFPNGTQFSFTPDNANLAVYSDPMCMYPPNTQPMGGGTDSTFYVKANDTGIAHTLTVAATSVLTGTKTVNILSQAANTTPPYPTLVMKTPNSIFAYTCYPVRFESWNYDSTVSANSAMQWLSSFSPTLSTLSGISFFSDSNCSNSGSSMVNFTTNSASVDMSFIYTGTLTNINIQPTGASSIQGGSAIAVTQPGAISKLAFSMPMNLNQGDCVPLNVNFVDANGHPSPVLSATSINLSSAGGQFYNSFDNSCMSATVSSIPLSSGQSGGNLRFRPTATGSVTVTAADSSSPLTGNQALTVSPAVATQLMAVVPGQTWSSGQNTVTGSPAPQGSGQSFPVDVYAVKYDYTIDTGFNGTFGNLTGTNVITPAANTVSFVNGHAHFTATASGPVNNWMSMSGNVQLPNNNASLSMGTIQIVPMASQFTIYGNPSGAALNPNACQVLMIVPEDANGLAMLPTSPVTVNLSFASGSGTLFQDAGCTVSQGPTLSMVAGDSYKVVYVHVSAAGALQTSAAGYATQNWNFTVAGPTAVGAPTILQLIGRTSPSYALQGACNPYLIYLADSAGAPVTLGTAVSTITVQMTSISGTTGYVSQTLSDCKSAIYIDNPPMSNTLTIPSGMTQNYVPVFGAAPPNPTSTEALNVNDSSATYTSYSAGHIATP